MINSMTGFGRTEAQTPDGQLQIEVRSVNHRYLDVQFKLPEGFRALEQALRDIVAARLKRGKVDVSLSLRRRPDQPVTTRINAEQARQVIGQLEELAAMLQAPAAISPAVILRMPGIVEEEQIEPETMFPAVTDALVSAIDQLAETRAREGARIHAMIDGRCADVLNLAAGIRARLPTVLAEIRNRLEQKIASLNAQIDPDRLEQELAIIAQKLDVSEANTLGSKSADTETTQAAVDLKVVIEQMREQVQNVE